MRDTINDFKNGIFALNTRRFGTVAEIMIKKLYQYQWSKTREYDLYDYNNDYRIEVKFSRAAKDHPKTINETNVIDQCLSDAYWENRFITTNDIDFYSFDSNIQQVKCRSFDYLFYGLFFIDCIEIYGIPSENVYEIPGYSDRQHAGNIGEGQFHLNNNSIDYHRQNCFQRALTYYELFKLLSS